jgi:hypothetical protein
MWIVLSREDRTPIELKLILSPMLFLSFAASIYYILRVYNLKRKYAVRNLLLIMRFHRNGTSIS